MLEEMIKVLLEAVSLTSGRVMSVYISPPPYPGNGRIGKAVLMPLEEKKRNLEEALCAKQPASQEKHRKWKKLEYDLGSVLSETKQREEELSNLSTEIEKLRKLATRRSYVERIKEITENSRKQDIDIECILKETRELQLESNMIQERLH